MIKKHSSYIVVILIVALLISAILNVFLFDRASRIYRKYLNTRLDPLGLKSYPADSPYSSLKKPDAKRLIIFGDSRASEWRFPDIPDRFEFINRGIGGQTSSQAIAGFDSHIKPLKPHFIVVQVGINDLKAIPILPTQKESIIISCKNNISQIVSKSLNLGSTVILTTIFPLGKVPIERRFLWSVDVSEAVNDVNNYIHSLKGPNVIVIDTEAILANETGIVRQEYSRDFLHITATGYKALNNELLKVLSK